MVLNALQRALQNVQHAIKQPLLAHHVLQASTDHQLVHHAQLTAQPELYVTQPQVSVHHVKPDSMEILVKLHADLTVLLVIKRQVLVLIAGLENSLEKIANAQLVQILVLQVLLAIQQEIVLPVQQDIMDLNANILVIGNALLVIFLQELVLLALVDIMVLLLALLALIIVLMERLVMRLLEIALLVSMDIGEINVKLDAQQLNVEYVYKVQVFVQHVRTIISDQLVRVVRQNAQRDNKI